VLSKALKDAKAAGKEAKAGAKRRSEERSRPKSKAPTGDDKTDGNIPNRSSYWERQVDQLERENDMLRESETRLQSRVGDLETELELLRAQAETTKRAVAVLFDAAHSDLQNALSETA
jgi:chromosome segregation ATPase